MRNFLSYTRLGGTSLRQYYKTKNLLAVSKFAPFDIVGKLLVLDATVTPAGTVNFCAEIFEPNMKQRTDFCQHTDTMGR